MGVPEGGERGRERAREKGSREENSKGGKRIKNLFKEIN